MSKSMQLKARAVNIHHNTFEHLLSYMASCDLQVYQSQSFLDIGHSKRQNMRWVQASFFRFIQSYQADQNYRKPLVQLLGVCPVSERIGHEDL